MSLNQQADLPCASSVYPCVRLVYLGLGSNVAPEKHLPIAYQSLAQFGELQRVSQVYQSPAIGIEGADFYNAALCLKTELSLHQLYQSIKALEQQYLVGGERAFDIDILLFGESAIEEMIGDKKVTLPREDIFKFPFVIQPLYELCPQFVVPNALDSLDSCKGKTVAEIWQSFGTSLASLKRVDLDFN